MPRNAWTDSLRQKVNSPCWGTTKYRLEWSTLQKGEWSIEIEFGWNINWTEGEKEVRRDGELDGL